MALSPIEEKIQLLLNKAAGNPNPHEAEAYQIAAEKLMIKHGVDEAMLASRENGRKEEVITISLAFTGIYAKSFVGGRGQRFVRSTGVCQSYQTQGYEAAKTRSGRDTYAEVVKLVIVGFKSDAEAMERLIRSIELQAMTAVKDFWKKHPARSQFTAMEGYKERREFINHFISGAAARIEANVNQVVSETTGAELVLADRLEEVKMSLPGDMRSTQQRMKGGTAHAKQSGWNAGQDAATDERGIGYGQRAIGR